MLDHNFIKNLEFGISKHRVENYLNGCINFNLQLSNFQRQMHSSSNSLKDREGAKKLYTILYNNKRNICLDLSNKYKQKTEKQFEPDTGKLITNHFPAKYFQNKNR